MALYPPTLGKIFLTAPILESIGVNKENVSINPLLELLRLAKDKREICCRLVAYHITDEKSDLLDTKYINGLSKTIDECFNDEDLATIVIAILKDTSVDEITKGTGIDKEAEDMKRVNAAKTSKNTFVFGGKTIWGSLIDAACERYKWTLDYVLWGISYDNLTLLLKDKVTSIYLTDEERKRVHIPDRSGGTVNGDDKEAVLRMIRESELHPS